MLQKIRVDVWQERLRSCQWVYSTSTSWRKASSPYAQPHFFHTIRFLSSTGLFNIAVPDIWFFSTSSSDPSNCLILRKSPIFAFWIREEEAGSVDDSSGVELCRRRLLLLLLAGLLSSRRRREERGRSGVDAVYDATDQTIWLVAPRVKPMEHFAWPNTWLGTCEIKLQAAGPAPHHN